MNHRTERDRRVWESLTPEEQAHIEAIRAAHNTPENRAREVADREAIHAAFAKASGDFEGAVNDLEAVIGPLARSVLSSVGPGIRKTPGVCGGAACVEATRIPVWQLVQAHDAGATEAEILTDYPVLTARLLAAAWDYADRHPEEIAGEIERNTGGGDGPDDRVRQGR